MKSKLLIYASALLIGAISAGCDDGDIYPSGEDLSGDNGMSIVLTGTINGMPSSYDSGLTLVLAAFKDGNDFAISTKNVGNGSNDIRIDNVSTSANTVELCLINSLRKRIFTIASRSVEGTAGEIITFDVGNVDASPFGVIQNSVFSSTCTQCHGATGHAAAGLDLQDGKAYKMLVGVESTVVAGKLRVNPGNASSSTLWEALATDDSEHWSFDHSNLLDSEKASFITNWINSLNND
ncbi:MAG: hypothetical protein NC201_07790 [Prevotella sp.]|nr:hypothetical protein [Bacteroides sp.]MCM1367130.1 hypothetical protein [Prevotella sp.]MCM1437436.1 hypothetical protein [Prevotella sp.]